MNLGHFERFLPAKVVKKYVSHVTALVVFCGAISRIHVNSVPSDKMLNNSPMDTPAMTAIR